MTDQSELSIQQSHVINKSMPCWARLRGSFFPEAVRSLIHCNVRISLLHCKITNFSCTNSNPYNIVTRGLIYKTVLRKDHYRWRMEETQEMRAHKNFLIYNRVRTHILRLFPFINPKSTWKRTQVYQPRIPPSHHPHSTINGQCKAPHGY